MAEIVPGGEDDNDGRGNENRAARYVRLDQPDVNEDARHDGGREWHEAILPAACSKLGHPPAPVDFLLLFPLQRDLH